MSALRARRSSPPACRASSPTASATGAEEPDLRDRVRLILTRLVLCVAGGFALGLAYPAIDWAGAAWIALAPVFYVAVTSTPRAAFGWGWLAGFAFFLPLLRWMNYTFRTYSEIPWPLTWAPTMALAGYCALYIGLVATAMAWIARRRGAGWAFLAAPVLWVAGEWIRGTVLGGFPWGELGYSQYRQLTVIQVAELGGAHAVSFVVCAVNAAIAATVVVEYRRALLGLAVAGALLASTLGFGRMRLAEAEPAPTVTIAGMQPSIEQPLKWDRSHTEATLRIYGDLTRKAAARKPDLIVWPETASPTLLRQDPYLLQALRDLSAQSGVPLLVGTVDVAETGRPRNTAFLLTEQGIIGRYDKIHLVPFGEFVPLSGVIGFVKGWAEFISELEPGARAVVFPGPPAPFGVVICYEGIFPELFRQFVRSGARVMVNMTNDAWFGRTEGPLQHLAMYPFRAVEHRTAVVRVANTGVSAFITPSGRIATSLGLFERGDLVGRAALRSRVTLYTRAGEWLAYTALVLSGGAVLAASMRKAA
ncbi:MAG: apolipoprotein N-acyltransferase [Candidatus Rokubacteria bacterium 13_1_40CM_68_15]|nr:MAG: apolipoprotein N-acyltransferase [Candidatus Rokubacteria bacterium 13_1_40CM_68_15]